MITSFQDDERMDAITNIKRVLVRIALYLEDYDGNTSAGAASQAESGGRAGRDHRSAARQTAQNTPQA
ncbi:hypothetical protein KTH_00210 [Thermosporothrix hazakensis]|nr:hypothetical protein KTH_00210 [Thermosporothrix hazakensis]